MNRPGMENRGTAQKYVGKLQKKVGDLDKDAEKEID